MQLTFMATNPVDMTNKENIIALSVDLELHAEMFYRQIAEKFPEEDEIFTSLANDEKYHANTYSKLFESELPSNINEAEISKTYLEALSQKGVITELLKTWDLTGYTLKGIVELAIRMEKNTEIFYYYSLGLFNNIDQKIVQSVLLSEHLHRKKLIDLQARLNMEED